MPRRGGGSSAGARGGRTAALAAPPAEVAAYLSERAERSKLATVRSAAAAIAAACRATGRADPTKTPLVADTLRGIARQHARQPAAAPRQARALTYDQAPRADARRPRIAGTVAVGSSPRPRPPGGRSSTPRLWRSGSAVASGAPRPRRASGPTFERDEQLRVRVRTSAGAR